MAAYQKHTKFMQRVRQVNPNFERWKKSSLRPLINVLTDNPGTVNQVRTALQAIPPIKADKYKDALYYLLATYPGLARYADEVNFGPLGKAEAGRFVQTSLPDNFDPSANGNFERVQTECQRLGLTVEQFIIGSPRPPGIILIHLSDWDDGMGMVFNGRSCIDHIKSVLSVGRKMHCELCILYMKKDKPVLAQLQAEVGFGNRVDVFEPKQHMGGKHDAFLQFAQRCQEVVVMGFDATVCVDANLFGTAETTDEGGWVPPLVTLANVTTSRAVLVTTGGLYSKAFSKDQWGWLYGT